MLKRVCLLVIILQLLTIPLYAQEYNALRKLSRGLVNSSLAVLELGRQVIKVTEAEGQVAGLFLGSLKGLVFTLGRTVIGMYELATFLVPSYMPVVEPEFIFSK
jgi:putative exosortase-associated protein (TIGR04073 family)